MTYEEIKSLKSKVWQKSTSHQFLVGSYFQCFFKATRWSYGTTIRGPRKASCLGWQHLMTFCTLPNMHKQGNIIWQTNTHKINNSNSHTHTGYLAIYQSHSQNHERQRYTLHEIWAHLSHQTHGLSSGASLSLQRLELAKLHESADHDTDSC